MITRIITMIAFITVTIIAMAIIGLTMTIIKIATGRRIAASVNLR